MRLYRSRPVGKQGQIASEYVVHVGKLEVGQTARLTAYPVT
jgi:hypothetical protein